MKRVLVFVPLAVLTSGCAPLMYSGYGYGRPLPPSYAMRSLAPAPSPVGRWDNVMRLAPQSTIDVLTLDGVPKVGPIVGADGQSVLVRVNGTEVRVARAEIVRVDLVALPGSDAGAVARSAARGAVLGAGAAVVISAVLGGPAWPPPGALVRAGVAGGAVSGGQAALISRQPRIIYLAPTQAPVRYPYSQMPYDGQPTSNPESFELPACAQGTSVAGIRQMPDSGGAESPVVRRAGRVSGFVQGAAGSTRR